MPQVRRTAVPVKDEDYRLSMAMSPRGRIPSDELRQLVVNRLSDTEKAVLRRSLSRDKISVFCEPCRRWTSAVNDVPDVYQCERCGRRYRIEFVVYEEIES
jgi:hypothetical protein